MHPWTWFLTESDRIASAVGMKTTTPIIPHLITASSNYALVSLFIMNKLSLAVKMTYCAFNDTCYVNGAVLIVWQVSAAAAALAAGGGDRKGPAVLQGDGHPDLHMPHGERFLHQQSCVCVCVCVWEWALTEALLYGECFLHQRSGVCVCLCLCLCVCLSVCVYVCVCVCEH